MSATYRRALRLAELPSGSVKTVRLSGKALVLAHTGSGVFALEAHCPHAGGDLGRGRLEGGRVTCPLHGSQFDVADGSVARGPAATPLACFPARIEGEWIEVEV